jgi:hypothetical protein
MLYVFCCFYLCDLRVVKNCRQEFSFWGFLVNLLLKKISEKNSDESNHANQMLKLNISENHSVKAIKKYLLLL